MARLFEPPQAQRLPQRGYLLETQSERHQNLICSEQFDLGLQSSLGDNSSVRSIWQSGLEACENDRCAC